MFSWVCQSHSNSNNEWNDEFDVTKDGNFTLCYVYYFFWVSPTTIFIFRVDACLSCSSPRATNIDVIGAKFELACLTRSVYEIHTQYRSKVKSHSTNSISWWLYVIFAIHSGLVYLFHLNNSCCVFRSSYFKRFTTYAQCEAQPTRRPKVAGRVEYPTAKPYVENSDFLHQHISFLHIAQHWFFLLIFLSVYALFLSVFQESGYMWGFSSH